MHLTAEALSYFITDFYKELGLICHEKDTNY